MSKERNPCDICILSEPCDNEVVEGLQYHLGVIKRTSGKNVSVFPHLPNSKQKFSDRSEALERSHAILIILSDHATARFKDEDGDTAPYFKLIKRALELEKANRVHILPLFLSERVQKDGLEGFAKFSNWSYKCKNEEVRAVMDRIGSLQGVFMDPDEESYEMKFNKLKSFWQETHQALVPLTLSNIKKELDWETIGWVAFGTFIGLPVLLLPLCLTCFSSQKKKWLHFRKGLILGNALILLSLALAFIIYGIRSNQNDCDEDLGSGDCNEGVKEFRGVSFTIGAIVFFAAMVEFAVAHLWAGAAVRKVLRNERKVRIATRATATTQSVRIKQDIEMHEIV